MAMDELLDYQTTFVDRCKTLETEGILGYDIQEYMNLYEDMSDEWYRNFAEIRIRGKCSGEHKIYPTATQDDIDFFVSDRSLMAFFMDYLKLWAKSEIFIGIENRLVMKSRDKGDLPKEQRQKNQKSLKSITHAADSNYAVIDRFLKEVTETRERTPFREFLCGYIDI